MTHEDFSPEMIFFDYGGTLDANGVSWKDRFYPLYAACGIAVPHERFDRAFYDADDSLTAEGVESRSLSETVREQVRRVLHNLGCYDRAAHELIAGRFYEDSLSCIQKNLGVLEHLRTRYRLGIISNNYGNLAAMCDETGLRPFMDVLADSRRVGAEKPDKRIFQFALDAAGLQACQALMVGDSLQRDMAGAKAIGIQHILLVSDTQKVEISTYCHRGRVITNLSQLLRVLPL